MRNNPESCFFIYFLSIILAMAMKIAPLAPTIQPFAPDWLLLVLLYWSQKLPGRYGVMNAWFIGFFTDVLTGRLLGQHALAYALASYFSLRLHYHLRQFEFFRQTLFLFFTLTFSHACIAWTQNLKNPELFKLAFWFPVFSGILVWPLIYLILHSLCMAKQKF